MRGYASCRISNRLLPWLDIGRAVTASPMSIDKESTGMPEIDLHRRTTKVNLATMIGILVFFIIVGIGIVWYASHHG